MSWEDICSKEREIEAQKIHVVSPKSQTVNQKAKAWVQTVWLLSPWVPLPLHPHLSCLLHWHQWGNPASLQPYLFGREVNLQGFPRWLSGKESSCPLFTMARTWKQPRCPSADEWIRKLWYIYTMEYYSAIKKNTFESVLMRWMKLEPIIQSEVSQKEKHQYSILMHIYGI